MEVNQLACQQKEKIEDTEPQFNEEDSRTIRPEYTITRSSREIGADEPASISRRYSRVIKKAINAD